MHNLITNHYWLPLPALVVTGLNVIPPELLIFPNIDGKVWIKKKRRKVQSYPVTETIIVEEDSVFCELDMPPFTKFPHHAKFCLSPECVLSVWTIYRRLLLSWIESFQTMLQRNVIYIKLIYPSVDEICWVLFPKIYLNCGFFVNGNVCQGIIYMVPHLILVHKEVKTAMLMYTHVTDVVYVVVNVGFS